MQSTSAVTITLKKKAKRDVHSHGIKILPWPLRCPVQIGQDTANVCLGFSLINGLQGFEKTPREKVERSYRTCEHKNMQHWLMGLAAQLNWTLSMPQPTTVNMIYCSAVKKIKEPIGISGAFPDISWHFLTKLLCRQEWPWGEKHWSFNKQTNEALNQGLEKKENPCSTQLWLLFYF